MTDYSPPTGRLSTSQTANSAKATKAKRINCFECEYLFITHEQNNRYGCRRFGFKGPNLPSNTVIATTGTKCAYFTMKKRLRMAESASIKSRGTK